MDSDVAVRYLLGLVMLTGALIPDLKIRRVPNQWWIPFAVMAIMLFVGDLIRNPDDWAIFAVAFALGVAFYGMWHFSLFGGADAKALMILAVLVPRPPHDELLQIPPALDALANGSLILMTAPILFFVYNAIRGDWAPVMWLGIRMQAADAERRHVWPMQQVDETGVLGWRYWQTIGMDQRATYAALQRHGLRRVWATPKIPLIGALLLGLGISWLWGNLVVRLAMALLG